MTESFCTFKSVGIIGKPGDPAVCQLLEQLLPILQEHGCRAYIDASSVTNNGYCENLRVPFAELLDSCELIIAIGGDGTLIHVARALAGRPNIALMGINRGRLGFLVDVHPDNLREVEQVLTGNYVIDERFLLTAQVHHNGAHKTTQPDSAVAVNEVSIHRWNTSRMIELSTWVDGEPLSDHRADGLIVSTPTGSTAYALAGGGPIVHPNLHAMVMVPVNPHSLSNRPLVIDSRSQVEIEVHAEFIDRVRVSCDSQQDLALSPGSRIIVRAHPTPLSMIHPPGYSYFNLLRAKLGWGGPPRELHASA
ncbi:NAD(+) kinase [Halorhodospira halochloris]|uniref:NAD(+) kinase n=1 Tax=Halorhodospira halochloris TaxID=1052 RepID=UPI001EE7FBCF|nr:NAD(+) kinase [Halorhodospira halochloris]MCG5531061.1 NAD(+) kinase [Halorhodospira halochloris]